MTVNRCQICKVAWEDGQPAKHLMTCTINDFLFFPSCHRKPTEMEDRVMAAMAGWGIGDDRFEVARAVIRAMREPTDDMLDVAWDDKDIKELVEENTPPINAVWETMIDAASPRDE